MRNLFIPLLLGGALGSVSRYFVYALMASITAFPLATLSVNFLGSFLFGFLLELNTAKLHLTEAWRLGIFVGFLGAFTTFSTFSMDVVQMIQKAHIIKASLYVFLSVFLSILCCFIGVKLGRFFFAA